MNGKSMRATIYRSAGAGPVYSGFLFVGIKFPYTALSFFYELVTYLCTLPISKKNSALSMKIFSQAYI